MRFVARVASDVPASQPCIISLLVVSDRPCLYARPYPCVCVPVVHIRRAHAVVVRGRSKHSLGSPYPIPPHSVTPPAPARVNSCNSPTSHTQRARQTRQDLILASSEVDTANALCDKWRAEEDAASEDNARLQVKIVVHGITHSSGPFSCG